MSTITREQAQKIIEAADEVITALAGTNEDVHPESDNMLRLWDDLNDRYAPPEVVRELARIALASLEAEAVCYLTWHQGFRAPDDCEEYVVEAKPGDKSCDGSPAFPVYAAPPAPVSVPDEMTPKQASRSYCGEVRGYRDGWNACRASMLQGAGGNYPVITDGWVIVPVELTPDMRSAWDSAPHTDDDDHDMQVAYRTMIAAAPQQEVTP